MGIKPTCPDYEAGVLARFIHARRHAPVAQELAYRIQIDGVTYRTVAVEIIA